MKKLSQQLTYWLGVVAVGLVVGLSLQFVQAWTEPTVAPPAGNVGAPLNTGSIGQGKSGGLILNTGGAATGLIVQNGSVGIGALTPSVGGEQDLKFDVEGAVGAQWYCDQDGNNCVAGNNFGGGGPAGYNFITFPNSDRVKIIKDGAEIDLYCEMYTGTFFGWGWVRNNGGVIEVRAKGRSSTPGSSTSKPGRPGRPEPEPEPVWNECDTGWVVGYKTECSPGDGYASKVKLRYTEASLDPSNSNPYCYDKGYWKGERTQWTNL